MKGKILGIVAILVIVMLAFVTIVVIAGDGIWSTPWEDDDDDDIPDSGSIGGEWGQEIVIEYADGTSESLKSSMDSLQTKLSINIGGKEVSMIKYNLKAKATGVGYNLVDVDLQNYVASWNLNDGNTVVNTVTTTASNYPPTIRTIEVDGSWHTVFGVTRDATTIAPSDLAAGTYTLSLVPSGSLSYEKDGAWIDADLPDTISFEVTIVEDGWLEVSFSSGYSTS